MAKTTIPSADVRDASLTDADIAAANKDGVKSTASMRTLSASTPAKVVPGGAGTAGTAQTASSSDHNHPMDAIAGGADYGFFGDGSDGDVTVNANPFTGGPITNNLLTRDAYFDTLTINTTRVIDTNGWRLFCKTALVNNGQLSFEGKAAVNLVQGQGAVATGGLGGGSAGGAGINQTVTAGNNGTAIAAAVGGVGGIGGQANVGPHLGGLGGVITAPTVASGGWRDVIAIIVGRTSYNQTRLNGGSGGGSGGTGAGVPPASGAGGGGGGICIIIAQAITNTNGIISANGGAGGNATVSNAGGGGGGGGGLLVLIYRTLAAGTETANGGTFGTPLGNATNGAVGNNGIVLKLTV